MTEKCACSILRLMAVATILIGVCMVAATLVSLFSGAFRAMGDAVLAVILGYGAVSGIGLGLFLLSPRIARSVVA